MEEARGGGGGVRETAVLDVECVSAGRRGLGEGHAQRAKKERKRRTEERKINLSRGSRTKPGRAVPSQGSLFILAFYSFWYLTFFPTAQAAQYFPESGDGNSLVSVTLGFIGRPPLTSPSFYCSQHRDMVQFWAGCNTVSFTETQCGYRPERPPVHRRGVKIVPSWSNCCHFPSLAGTVPARAPSPHI